MARSFKFPLKRRPEEMFRELSQLADSKGWMLKGDSQKGSFSDSTGMLTGHYEVRGNTVHVTITNKPFLFSWETIRNKLAEYFG